MTNIDVKTSADLFKKDIDGYFPIMLEIYNPDITWTNEAKKIYKQDDSYLRIIADENKVVYKGKTYLPCAMEYTEPESDGSKIGNPQLTISAIDSRVKRVLRTIKIPSTVNIVAMFVKTEKENTTGKFIYKFVEISTASFSMKTAGSNKTTATFNLIFDNAFSQNVPYDIATQDRVPSTKGQ